MSIEKQDIEKKRFALTKFQQLLENRSGLIFKKNLAEHFFFYILASWGLSLEDRHLLSNFFIKEFKKEIQNFCRTNCIHAELIEIGDIHKYLENNENVLNNDIFIRRLILHFMRSHKNFFHRLLYRFPSAEHQEALKRHLDDCKKISLIQKERIHTDAEKSRKEFIIDIESYQRKFNFEEFLITFILFSIPLSISLFFMLKLKFVHYFLLNMEIKDPISMLFISSGIIFAFYSIVYISTGKLIEYEQTRRWANFKHIEDLPEEFKDVLLQNIEDLLKEIFKHHLFMPQKKIVKTTLNSFSHSNKIGFVPSMNEGSSFPVPFKSENKPKKIDKDSFVSHPPQETNKLFFKKDFSEKIIEWKIREITISFNSSKRKNVIELWNLSSAQPSHDFVHWPSNVIRKIINDETIYHKLALIAWDGHSVRAKNQQGFKKYKDEKGNTILELKPKKVFLSNKRLLFFPLAKTKNEDNTTAVLYGSPQYVSKAH
jgi:hypothetical protein